MSTIITAADAAEFLALVPRLAGFRPVRSVAIVPFQGRRTLGVLRADLPGDDADADSVAATLVGMVCKVRHADALAIVVYTDAAFSGVGADDGGPAHGRLAQALTRAADVCGLRVAEALCVAADGWGSYLDAAQGAPRPLDELDDTSIDERLPEELRGPLGDQAAGAELPPVDLALTERTARALQTLDDAIDAISHATGIERAAHEDLARLDPLALAAACALDDIPALFEDALEWDPARLRPFDAAALIWCLARPALRDVALVQWASGIESGDAALDAQLRWEEGEEYPPDLAAHLWGEADRPSAERLATALDLVRHAAAAAPRDERAGPLSVCAWLSWALGRSTHAAWYADQAALIEPEHGLTGILHAMIAAGHLPEWAFAPPQER